MTRLLCAAAALALLAACGGQDASEEAEADIGLDQRDGPTAEELFAMAPQTVAGLRNPASFVNIESLPERSAALYTELHKVIEHPRCMNCHPRSDSPRQGELMALHQPPVTRGEGGMGAVGMECTTCHGAENVEYVGAEGSIPGHEPWHLAPASMGWIGLSAPEICAQIKDPDRNGGKSFADLYEHNAHDGLVGWGWAPGEGREPAPGSQEVFGQLTRAWLETGAHCPADTRQAALAE